MNIQKLLIITLLIFSCNNRNKKVESCMENEGHGRMFVFIGEKIEVKELDYEKGEMDSKFTAKYKIIEKICGNYIGDTIEFTVYDHYGRPAFEKFSTVMLYLSEYEGEYYHEKYQYNNLYKTKDGRWASPYDWLEFDLDDTLNNPFKPVKIDYLNEVSFSTARLKKQDIRQLYPEPFYKIVDTKAVAIYGNYVPELLEIKKKGVFNARGLFGVPDTSNKIEPNEMKIEDVEPYSISKAESKKLITSWLQFLNAINSRDSQELKRLSLDSVICSVCEGFESQHFYNDVEPIDSFIRSSFKNLKESQLWEKLKSEKFEIHVAKYPDRKPLHFRLPNNESLIIYTIGYKMITTFENSKYQQYHSFEFVKVNGEFKFYGMRSD